MNAGIEQQPHDSTNYATTDNVNDGIAWINRQGDNSCFLWMAFNALHAPHHRPPNDLYDYDTIADEGDYESREHFEVFFQFCLRERLSQHSENVGGVFAAPSGGGGSCK